jgi:hypothetical protein
MGDDRVLLGAVLLGEIEWILEGRPLDVVPDPSGRRPAWLARGDLLVRQGGHHEPNDIFPTGLELMTASVRVGLMIEPDGRMMGRPSVSF